MSKESSLYIGVMSGTSLDGVDVALCTVDAHNCRLIHSLEYPLPQTLKDEILSSINQTTTLKQVGSLHTKLGFLFSDAINALLEKYVLNPEQIEALGVHGQTLWHEPNAVYPFSLQLGNANVIATQTKIKTISDFRGMDVANGGEGAPFAPAFHKFLFGSSAKKRAVLNIGGMANLTILDEKTLGFDVGCGNVLLDLWVDKKCSQKYDKDGEFAKEGILNEILLKSMLDDEYFKKLPPKSTGREYLNLRWLEKYIQKVSTLSDTDIQRTLLELTAKSIANEVKRYKIEELILCGGGAKNLFLVERLEKLCGCKVVFSDEYGANGDFLEAMLFAWLAYKRLHNESVDLKDITGAKKNSILGAIYEAN